MPNKKQRLSVPKAAALMGCNPQFLRLALQQGRFSEFGVAIKRKRWAYYINTARFYRWLEGKLEKKEVSSLKLPDGRKNDHKNQTV